MYGRINYAQQKIAINNHILSGVQNIDLSTPFAVVPINILGYGMLTPYSQKIPISTLSVNRYIVGIDPLYNMCLNQDTISGTCIFKDKYFSFDTHANINSYTLSCNINELVNSNTSIQIYGNINTGYTTAEFLTNLDNANSGFNISTQIPSYQSVSIIMDEPLVDRIIGFDYALSVDKQPIYGIGSPYPLDYHIVYPIEQKLTLTVELDENHIKNIENKMCNQFSQNIDLYITTMCSETTIIHLNFPNAVLTNQNYKGSINDNRVVTQLEFTQYLNDETVDPSLAEHVQYYIMTGYTIPEPSRPTSAVYYMPAYTGYLN